jgi:hypothetical protein
LVSGTRRSACRTFVDGFVGGVTISFYLPQRACLPIGASTIYRSRARYVTANGNLADRIFAMVLHTHDKQRRHRSLRAHARAEFLCFGRTRSRMTHAGSSRNIISSNGMRDAANERQHTAPPSSSSSPPPARLFALEDGNFFAASASFSRIFFRDASTRPSSGCPPPASQSFEL